VKFLIKLSLGFIILICIFYFIFLSERNKNLESDLSVKQWIGKTFEIKKGVYIFKFDDNLSGRHHLALPHNNTHFPSNVEEFLKDPETWFYCSESWCRPVMPGTHFRILKIFKHIKPAVGEFLIIEAVMLDGDYKNFRVKINALFNYDLWSFQIFGPKEEFV
jgi:hypothetical protein